MNVKEVLYHPRLLLYELGIKGFIRFGRDDNYVKMMYWAKFGKKLDLKAPLTFNQKMQYMKISYRDPLFTRMVDKYDVKTYILEKTGKDYSVPTCGVWNNVEDIDIDALPERFVLKCTHDSHTVFICKDRKKFDFTKAKHKIQKSMKRNYYWIGREYPYNNVEPRIIAEEYLENADGGDLVDYKFYMFNGINKLISVTERKPNHVVTIDYFDEQFNSIPMTWGYPNSTEIREKPDHLDEMKEIAHLLSQNHPFLRVDMYLVNDRIYIGELTFYDGSGFDEIKPYKMDVELGNMIHFS